MISIIESGALLNPDMTPMNSASATLVGLSTDSKPTGANGWIFSEIDTGKIYIYDAENSQWREWSGGGSGGGGGSDTIVLYSGSFDKTWQELYDSLALGKRIVVIDENSAQGMSWCFSGQLVSAYTMDNYYFVDVIFCYPSGDYSEVAASSFRTDSANGYPEPVE